MVKDKSFGLNIRYSDSFPFLNYTEPHSACSQDGYRCTYRISDWSFRLHSNTYSSAAATKWFVQGMDYFLINSIHNVRALHHCWGPLQNNGKPPPPHNHHPQIDLDLYLSAE